jgi:hypothetical protein
MALRSMVGEENRIGWLKRSKTVQWELMGMGVVEPLERRVLAVLPFAESPH